MRKALPISMASGTNAFIFNRRKLEEVLPHLTYLRVNFSAGTRDRYAQIMGVKPESFDRVVQNVRDMMEIKRRNNLKVTIGLQMVLMPQDADQIVADCSDLIAKHSLDPGNVRDVVVRALLGEQPLQDLATVEVADVDLDRRLRHRRLLRLGRLGRLFRARRLFGRRRRERGSRHCQQGEKGSE